VDLPPGPYEAEDLETLREAFFAAYARAYGDRTFQRDWPVVGVHWRLRATAVGAVLRLEPVGPGSGPTPKTRRQVWFAESAGFTDCPVYDRYTLGAGDRIAGPAIVEERESTIVLPPGSVSVVDSHGHLVTDLGVTDLATGAA
jgi:N-methylhydantoinase A/oxoprolinase/acetone carboxylase beta subunit